MINDFFNILLPQFCLVIFIILQLILSIFISPKNYKYSRLISAVGIVLSIVLLSMVQVEPQYFGLNNTVMSDTYTQLFHFVILLCGFFIVLITRNLISTIKTNAFSFNALLLTAILGAMSTVSSNDFLTLFISIELISFPTYFLISSTKGYYSKEASFKYLITSAISTGVFLYGVSYLYGITSSLDINEIYEIMISNRHSALFAFSGVMVILGLFAKLSIFPFANWIIDVYKGSETSVLAYLSTIPKLALIGIICRLIIFPLGGTFELTITIILLSLITAFWANTYALREKNVKAILACSSAANISYIMIAASIVSVYNLSTVIFYLICYVLMNISVFSFLNIIEVDNQNLVLDDLKGLYKKSPLYTLAYAISVIGLAGFPITSGFVAKIYLFSAIANSGLIFIPFLIILLILTVIALHYYLKLISPLFVAMHESTKLNPIYSQKFVLLITTLATLIIGIYPEKLIELCKFIAYSI